MAYKIQGLDSDSFVSAKQKAQSKNSNGSQQGGKQHAGALMGVLSSNLDELQLNLQPHDDGEVSTKIKPKTFHVSSDTLQSVLADIAALTNKLQQLESKFQNSKNTMDTKIGKAAISAAQTAAHKLKTQLAEAAAKQSEMKWLGILADVVEGIMFAIAAVTGQIEMCVAMVVLFAAQESGETQKFTALVSTGLQDCGCSPKVANILASVITIVAEVILTIGVCGMASVVEGGLQGAKTATQAAVNEIVEEAVQSAVKKAVSSAVKGALERGVKMGSSEMEGIIENAASSEAETISTDLANQGLGSKLVNKAVEQGIKKGIEQGVKQGAEEAAQAGVNVSIKAAKSIGKKLAKSLAKKLAQDVAKEMGEIAAKSVEDLPPQMQTKLQVAAKEIERRRLIGAIAVTVGGGMNSSELIENIVALVPEDKKTDRILLTILLELLSIGATIAGGVYGAGGLSNVGSALKGAAGDGEAAESNVLSRMLKSIMSKMITNPARMMSYGQTGAGLAEAGTQVAMANAQIKMSEIEDQMALSKPEMQENTAIAKIQDQIQAQDRKLFEELYKAIPTILADANSIGAIFASAAQAISA